MQSVEVKQLQNDAEGVIAAAQAQDVLVTSQGKVVAVVSRPREVDEFSAYWEQRERRLASVQSPSGWNSTQAVSEDRDRA